MKKILFAAMALVTISFASCNGCASKLDEIQKAADSVSAIVDSANAELTLLKLSLRNNSCELSSQT